MTWSLARINADALASEADIRFAPEAAAEKPFLNALRQRFASDEDLAHQLQAGNADALTVLFKRHSALLFGLARRILRNDAEAEDTVQQIFLDAYRAIHQFDATRAPFKTWLLLFAYHRTCNSRRSQIARHFFDTDPLEDHFIHPKLVSPDTTILAAQVMRSLEPRERRTIELIYYEGLTAEEVSQCTGETASVVRHNLYRGLDKLRKAYSQPKGAQR